MGCCHSWRSSARRKREGETLGEAIGKMGEITFPAAKVEKGTTAAFFVLARR